MPVCAHILALLGMTHEGKVVLNSSTVILNKVKDLDRVNAVLARR
jgi:hypothetical protein